ncbi:MAG: septal ring lytic transglycosylase RlpA family protein [Bacteroidia bacterium]|nr:septal ring lytic transglycosylase RlpA family protein [Bacteroidia bacterium]
MSVQSKYKITVGLLICLFFLGGWYNHLESKPYPPLILQTSVDSSFVVFKQTGLASYYANRFHGRRTASGERYNKYKLTAAHRTLPFGTLVRVSDAKTGKWLVVKINDRGPHNYKRIIDLSYEAARQLGLTKGRGLLKVKLRVVEWPQGYQEKE